jgi:hypothetical protein
MKQLLQSDSKLNNYISSSSSISIIGLEDENNKIILAFFLIYKNPKHFYPCTFVYIYICVWSQKYLWPIFNFVLFLLGLYGRSISAHLLLALHTPGPKISVSTRRQVLLHLKIQQKNFSGGRQRLTTTSYKLSNAQ